MQYKNPFQSSLDDGDAFSWWVVQYPVLAERVETCLMVLDQVKGSTHLVDLLAGRDAAQQLHLIAREGHFDEAAAIFSSVYDDCCRAVLPYFYEVH